MARDDRDPKNDGAGDQPEVVFGDDEGEVIRAGEPPEVFIPPPNFDGDLIGPLQPGDPDPRVFVPPDEDFEPFEEFHGPEDPPDLFEPEVEIGGAGGGRPGLGVGGKPEELV